MWMKALTQSAVPSRFSAAVGLLVATGMWVSVSATVALTLSDAEINVAGSTMLVGLTVLPIGAAVLGFGALFSRTWTARGLQFLIATTMLLGAWFMISVGFGAQAGVAEGLTVGTFVMFLPLIASALVTVVHAVASVPEVRRTREQLHTDWLTHNLDLRGWLSADEIRQQTGWHLDRAESVSDAAKFEATVEGNRLRLDAVAQRHRERILAMVQTRGQVSLDELGRALQESRDALEHRIAELQASGDFHGYRDGDTLYSSDLTKLRALSGCPACAGPLDLAGQGLIRCEQCDAVVYL